MNTLINEQVEQFSMTITTSNKYVNSRSVRMSHTYTEFGYQQLESNRQKPNYTAKKKTSSTKKIHRECLINYC